MGIRAISGASRLAIASLSLALGAAGVASRPHDAASPSVQVKVIVIESTRQAAKANIGADALIKAGGKVVTAPIVRALSGMAAKVAEMQVLPYTVRTGDKASPTRKATVSVGWSMELVPTVNPDGTVQLELDLLSSEPGPGGPPELVKRGFFNSLWLNPGSVVRFGSWAKGGKVVTVFASATVDKP